ncbi:MAG: hypothetical protein LBS81_00140 [Endomicrobium sp.]|jgi:hypothetical protein|nr:hypothetical protein [Endomicrobium sp.]
MVAGIFKDTIERLKKFKDLKTSAYQYCLTGDSRTMDIKYELSKKTK